MTRRWHAETISSRPVHEIFLEKDLNFESGEEESFSLKYEQERRMDRWLVVIKGDGNSAHASRSMCAGTK